jgi:hypothetical protein
MLDPYVKEGQIITSLQSLLLVRPIEVETHKTIALTTIPQAWRSEANIREGVIVNLSTLLGVSKPTWVISERAILDEVVVKLIEGGWPREQIFTEYRADYRSRSVVDVAVFDSAKRLQLAIEVIRPQLMSERGIQAAFEQLSNTVSAKWHCVTDGNQFYLVNTEIGDRRALEQAPSVSDLGLTADDGTTRLRLKQKNVFTPQTLEDLLSFAAEYQPQAAIIDHTLPWGMRLERYMSRYGEVSSLQELLPHAANAPARGRIEALHVFIAWTASLPSIKSLASIIPSSVAAAPAYQWLRQYLHERLGLCGIIELPTDLYGHSASLTSTLFYLGGERTKAYFDVLSSRGDLIDIGSRPWFESLTKWMKGKEPTTGYAVSVDSQTLWAAGPNDPEIERIYERLGRIGELVSLGEFCEIRRGIPLGREVVEDENGIPYVQGRNIREGYLNLEDARRLKIENMPEWALLRNGDFLLSEVVTERSSVILNQSDEPAILSHSLIVLRPQRDVVSAEYLLEYLNSSTAQKLILANAGRLGGLRRISALRLRELKVPIVSPELFQGLSDIKQTEAELRSKADELESTRRSLFDSENGQVFGDRVNSLKRSGKILATSIESSRRLEFQIANFYPFPIAYSFRLLASIVNPAELYKEQLRVAENLLAFIASVSLSLLQREDREGSGIDFINYWQGGISPGDWKDITARCSKIFAAYKDFPLASAIQRLNIGSEKKGLGPKAKQLVEALNDFKHHRGPTVEEDYVKASKEVEAALVDAMERIAFFTEYPIRQVQDINVRRRSEKVDLKCLRYTGDHPGLPQEEVVFDRPLHKGDLFIDLGRQGWISLYPFITSMNCPNCKTRETYLIDKWDEGRGVAYLKSFERGHSESKKEIADALLDW